MTVRQSQGFGPVPKIRPTWNRKRPRSNPDKPTPTETPAGMGTRCRSGRRPGGAGLAITDQGLQVYLNLPAGYDAVSQSRQCVKAHVKAWDSVRTKAMRRKPARAEESPTAPELAKGPPATGRADGLWEPGAGGWRPGGSETA